MYPILKDINNKNLLKLAKNESAYMNNTKKTLLLLIAKHILALV
jgi:hypothetical protein